MAVEKTPNVPPFVSYCAQLIPTVFDNSLSYYEALAALAKWMQDNLVDVINNNAAVTEQYIQMTEDLKSYVENYFDNLDVQEEINNKLDQMAEDGTLQEIITAYIQSNVAWCFDSVTDMKSSSNLVNGSYAQTLGYHTKGDGGASIYYIDTTGTADEASIIAIGDTLKAHLVLTDKIVAEQFGAYGDDTHDDTVAIQKAITASNNNGLPVELISGKVYKITDTLNISNDFIMNGQLNYSGVGVAVQIGQTGSTTSKKTFKLNIASNTAYSENTSIGAKMINLYSCAIEIEYVGGFYKGVQFVGSTNKGFVYNIINIYQIESFKTGVELLNDNGGWVNENHINGGRIQNDSAFAYHGSETGVKLTSTSTYLNNNNTFDGQCVEGCNIGFDLEYARYNQIFNARMENVTTAVKFGDTSKNNYIEIGYGTSSVSNMVETNVVLNADEILMNAYTKEIFNSGDINANAVSTSSSRCNTTMVSSLMTNAPVTNIKGGVVDGKIKLSSQAAIGTMLNLDSTDKTVLFTRSGDASRFCLISFDDNNEVINEAPVTSLGSTLSSYTSSVLDSTVFRSGSNSTNNAIIKFPATAVKAYIGVMAPANNTTINQIAVYAKPESNTTSEQLVNTSFAILPAAPISTGKLGQIVLSSDSSIKGWRYNGTSWETL